VPFACAPVSPFQSFYQLTLVHEWRYGDFASENHPSMHVLVSYSPFWHCGLANFWGGATLKPINIWSWNCIWQQTLQKYEAVSKFVIYRTKNKTLSCENVVTLWLLEMSRKPFNLVKWNTEVGCKPWYILFMIVFDYLQFNSYESDENSGLWIYICRT
jgi:hypothetical protein